MSGEFDKDAQGGDKTSATSSGLERVKGSRPRSRQKGRRLGRNAQVGNKASAKTKERAIKVGEADIKDERKGKEKGD